MLLSGSKSHRGSATFEAMMLAAGAVMLVVVADLTPLDSAVRALLTPLEARLFSPTRTLWTFSITTGFLTVGMLAILSGRTQRRYGARAECWRENGIFLILLLLIGPALGDLLGLAPSAVGFYAAAGWWIGRRHHPGWAVVSLASGLILGLALGLSGLATGSLRLSEFLWSGLAVLGLAHALNYYYVRLPSSARPMEHDPWALRNQREASARLRGLPAMCLLLVVAAVARLPHDARWARQHWVAHGQEQGLVRLQQGPRSVQPRLR